MSIPLFKVYIPENMGTLLNPVLQSGYISEGPRAKEFERLFQEWIGNPYIGICNSGTSAIQLALRLCDVGPGDEVITSPMTCLATNEPILIAGAKPVWADIDPNTGNIDVSKVESLITSKTKAILFVDWAGTPCQLEQLNEIAHDHGIKTIEDAAHALGAKFKGKNVGTVADYTVFSFQAIKHLTTVDGGALAMQTKEDYERFILLRWFGCKRGHNTSPIKWEGDVIEPGYKMHMNDVNATIGIEQMKTIDKRIEGHKKNGKSLAELLRDCKGIELPVVPDYIESAYWIFTLKVDQDIRPKFSEFLTEKGIGNNIVHTRNDNYSLFKDYKRKLPGVDNFGPRMLSIPCGWWVSEVEIAGIADMVYKFFK